MTSFVLFNLQFTFMLVAYAVGAWWYVEPRLAALPRELALVPLLWVHVFRMVGGTILAPGSVDPGVPMEFQTVVGIGDMATGLLALLALIALRVRFSAAIAVVWVFVVFGTLDTANAFVQSLRHGVFNYPLGFNWVIVTAYVPALLVSDVLIYMHLLRPSRRPTSLS